MAIAWLRFEVCILLILFLLKWGNKFVCKRTSGIIISIKFGTKLQHRSLLPWYLCVLNRKHLLIFLVYSTKANIFGVFARVFRMLHMHTQDCSCCLRVYTQACLSTGEYFWVLGTLYGITGKLLHVGHLSIVAVEIYTFLPIQSERHGKTSW